MGCCFSSTTATDDENERRRRSTGRNASSNHNRQRITNNARREMDGRFRQHQHRGHRQTMSSEYVFGVKNPFAKFMMGNGSQEEEEDQEDELKNKRRALEIVQMWRVRGRVPLAIDAHAQIVELQLMDEEVMREKKRRRNESTLRLSYAMTLTRLVNGICDPSQKGKFAMSVQTLATQLNVPRTLVDIRHDSTHNQLPSIQRLRKASEDAIGWLDANYWERQKRKLEHVTEEMRLVIRAMVECERGQNVKKSKDESNSSDDDESMYDSEEEMHAKTEKANKMKREKETRKKTKNSAVGRLKRLVPRSKPDRMLVHAFVRELLDAKEEEMLLIVENSSYDKTDPDEDLGEKNNTDEIVRAFSNVIDQIDSRVVDGFSCAILEFGTEELLHDLANDARQIINPIFEFAWKHAVSRDVAKATFIAEWYQRRGNDSVRGSNTSEYVQNKFQTLLSLDGGGGAIAADGGGSKNKKKNAKTQNNNKKRQKEEEDTIAWRKAKPGEWIPGAPIGAPIRALFPPRELGDEGDDEKIVLESDAFTPRKKQKMERERDTNFLTTRNEELALDLEYNDINEAEDTEDDTENEDEQPPNSVLLREDEDEFDDDDDKDEEEEQEEEEEKELLLDFFPLLLLLLLLPPPPPPSLVLVSKTSANNFRKLCFSTFLQSPPFVFSVNLASRKTSSSSFSPSSSSSSFPSPSFFIILFSTTSDLSRVT
mmetsp:Transcript_3412/g.11548  ORF Transcript_3412/g.11548 Transcript_3412/m.11548 type:complete len:710 (-) Transcript_3412:481-2610(-)